MAVRMSQRGGVLEGSIRFRRSGLGGGKPTCHSMMEWYSAVGDNAGALAAAQQRSRDRSLAKVAPFFSEGVALQPPQRGAELSAKSCERRFDESVAGFGSDRPLRPLRPHSLIARRTFSLLPSEAGAGAATRSSTPSSGQERPPPAPSSSRSSRGVATPDAPRQQAPCAMGQWPPPLPPARGPPLGALPGMAHRRSASPGPLSPMPSQRSSHSSASQPTTASSTPCSEPPRSREGSARSSSATRSALRPPSTGRSRPKRVTFSSDCKVAPPSSITDLLSLCRDTSDDRRDIAPPLMDSRRLFFGASEHNSDDQHRRAPSVRASC
mmetsp:Transcript_78745/g.228607  ORF Transcript_78745/g.228607 Transcript_78745/m.228607 type:complete len:324 (-) Transcript_78745:376-1347(-)